MDNLTPILNEITDIHRQLSLDIANSRKYYYSDYYKKLSLLTANVINAYDKQRVINLLLDLSAKSKHPKIQNIFLNESEILQQKTVLKSKPRNMQVLLTNSCNLRCSICDVYLKPYSLPNEAITFIKNNIPYLEKIIWQGGEVFLHKDFDYLMELAGVNNVTQDIITNGLLLTDNRLKKLAQYSVDLKISIDAVDKNTYEKIRVGADFDKLLSVLSSLKQYQDYAYSMAAVVTSLNYNQINELVDFAIKYGFFSIIFQRYTPYSNKSLILTDKQHDEVIRQLSALKQKADKKAIPINVYTDMQLENNEKPENEENKHQEEHKEEAKNDCYNLFCHAPWTTMFLDMDDKLMFSCRCKSTKIQNYDEVWNNNSAIAYRKMIIDNNNLYECCQACKNAGDNGKFSRRGLL
jgi:MoaA/NifB/PqqE/SkfB family radical SAM enzyme